MPFPKQKDVALPLLIALADRGGQARPRDVYGSVADYFGLSESEREQRLDSTPSVRKWWNLVQWVRQHLVEQGEIDGSTRGIWKITDKGRLRVTGSPAEKTAAGLGEGITESSLQDLVNSNRDAVKSRLLTELNSLTPTQFEHFCRELLQHLGYRDVEVTQRSADGGLDGFGDFKQGVVSIKSAFQAKRWKDASVGRPEIDKFRGAIQGDYEHGVFITTSRFAKPAQEASYKKGAVTILLLDGASITELMVERAIGVLREPLYLYDIDSEFFDFGEVDE